MNPSVEPEATGNAEPAPAETSPAERPPPAKFKPLGQLSRELAELVESDKRFAADVAAAARGYADGTAEMASADDPEGPDGGRPRWLNEAAADLAAHARQIMAGSGYQLGEAEQVEGPEHRRYEQSREARARARASYEEAEALGQQSRHGTRSPPRTISIEVVVRLTALAIPEEGGGYSVVVPALPGCFTDGATIEDARAHAVDAAEGWLASMHDAEREGAVRACMP